MKSVAGLIRAGSANAWRADAVAAFGLCLIQAFVCLLHKFARRHARLSWADVARLSPGLKRARAFLITADHHPGAMIDRADLRALLAPRPVQMGLFA